MTCLKNFTCILALAVSAISVKDIRGQIAPAGASNGSARTETQSGSVAKSGAASANSAQSRGYVIGSDDVLSISVWKEPDLTKSVPVRSDGKITLPLVGELQAAGRTPEELEHDITTGLKNYIADPEVSVSVQQVNSQKFNILGNISRPGSYALTTGTTIVDAIALAGGFRDFAKKKGIYVLRPSGGQQTRINFNYDTYIKGKNLPQNIPVMPRDTIVIP